MMTPDRRVVLALHGYGSTGAEIAAALSAAPSAALTGAGHQALILAPDGPEPATVVSAGRSWYPVSSVPDAMRARSGPVAGRLAAYLGEVQRSRRVGPEDCCVIGFSQGSPVAARLAESGAARSVVFICGRIPRPAGPWPSGIRALAIAGELDRFAPPDVMRADFAASGLDAARGELVVIPGAGHELRPDVAAAAMAFAIAPGAVASDVMSCEGNQAL
jgi:predicted esterase